MWWVYIIDKRGKFYVVIATDLDNRLGQHGVKSVLYKQPFSSRQEAGQRERELKGWSREKKIRLIAKFSGEFMLNEVK
jgi:predicted GIY-YIG superfamily endonuclease